MTTKRKKNSAAALGAGAAIGGTVGYVMGRIRGAPPDIDARLDEVEQLLKDKKTEEASALLMEAFNGLGTTYNQLGGRPEDLRKRMINLNKRLPTREQLFVLQPQLKKLKNKLLR